MSGEPPCPSAIATTGERRLTQLAGIRGAWGLLLVIVPSTAIEIVPGASPTRVARTVARVVGARHLLQAVAALRGSRVARRMWRTDALHSITMLGLALVTARGRRLTSADGLTAAAFALTTRTAGRS